MKTAQIKNIALLTSGGDAPGMNACIRALVRTGIYHGINMFGVYQGYQGLVDNNIKAMDARSVSNILHLGGTILKTARCESFKTEAGMQQAYSHLKALEIDALVVIGGDGTFNGALQFSEKFNFPVMGIPGTIDNDLYGSDFTLGFDTAINTVTEAIDKIRDTADSHDRLFFIEVMGRHAGGIALRSSIASGAEAVLLPERDTGIDELIADLERGALHKKSSSIVIVAEGNKHGGAYEIAKIVNERFTHYDTKVTILGHLQRGGSPTSYDRILGARLGFAAIKTLMEGHHNLMVGLRGNQIQRCSLVESLNSNTFSLEEDLMEMTKTLAI